MDYEFNQLENDIINQNYQKEGEKSKIFIAVSGNSPQIITETLYALIQEEEWIPDEIILITTELGRKIVVKQLLANNKIQQLLDDLGIKQPIDFNEDSILVIQSKDSKPLYDLRTPEDNEAAADCICSVVRELTKNPETELHVSLAGGRKTMGFYAGYALSMFGRSQDCLSHVLVSEQFEANPDFFYPSSTSQIILSQDKKPLDTQQARVWLSKIPFIRLRNRLSNTLLTGKHSFSETVSLARQATESVQLTLYPSSCRYRVNDIYGELNPVQMALLLWVVTRQISHKPPVESVVEGEKRSAKELITTAEGHWLNLNIKTEETLNRDGITQSWLEQTTSKLNRSFKNTLGVELAKRCKLASRKNNGNRVYSLPIDLILKIQSE